MATAGEQVYTGPVTHALSNAVPSPAAAGPMQAKRNWFGGKKKTKPAPALIQEPEPAREPEPQSEYAADFDLLNSQTGSEEVRKQAYNNIAVPTANNMTAQQRSAVTDYVASSTDINAYLRGQKNSPFYPKPKQVQDVVQKANDISQAIRNNPLKENLTTYRGTTDGFLAFLLEQNGLKKGLNKNGTVNHQWLNKNQKTLRKKLVGSVFHDKAFTSTSTEKDFARDWARKEVIREKKQKLYDEDAGYDEIAAVQEEADAHPERIPGAHLLSINMPKGANASFIDRATDIKKAGHGEDNQREVLADKGSMFKISDIRKMEDADSYELVMDLLAEEAGKKKK